MIVLAFDSYKGCMSAEEACQAAAQGIINVIPDAEIRQVPLSDGGEGLVSCISKILPVSSVAVKVHDPLMNIIAANYALSTDSNTAFMEMASASGLPLVPLDKRNPMITTTYGVGDLIIDAIKRGCKEIIMGIGGSATCDGGKGMIQCLVDNGYIIKNVNECIIKEELKACKFTIACDVTNPLYGSNGAAFIFAPQKGATQEQVIELDQMLRDFAFETESLGLSSQDRATYPGAGAAGGLGYSLMSYLNAELKSGIDIILGITHFEEQIQEAELVITGEGKSDEQTLMGKVPHGVLKLCKKHNIPVWLLSGCIEDKDSCLSNSFDLTKSINENDQRPLSVLMQKEVAENNMQSTLASLFNNN